MMNMESRNQYLKELRSEYLKIKYRKERGRLLNEARKRTGLARKYLIRKLKPKSNLDKKKEDRKKRKVIYDGYFKTALVQVWEILDYPCGQRLISSLRETDIVDKLRNLGELDCSDEVAKKLRIVGSVTIDEKLRHQKEVLRMIEKVKEYDLAEYCDVFMERGAFSKKETADILKKAKACGFKLKLHAGQFHDIGGAELGAELGAVSIDHLDYISQKGMESMAENKTIAVLLPGVPFHLMSKRYAPARKMIELGVPIALATDFNPGSCPTLSMQMIIALACRQMKLTPAEAINAATINAAYAVNRADKIGSIRARKKADLIILNIENHRQLPYWFGMNLVDRVIKNGQVI